MAKRKSHWEPSGSDYQQVFDTQNPWHSTGVVPEEVAHSEERTLGQVLWRRLVDDSPRRFHVILGPRRVGKTVSVLQAARHLLRERIDRRRVWFLRLDHPLLMLVELGDLLGYVTSAARSAPDRPAFVFLDEVVYAKNWRLWLKTFYDDQWPVRIAATSSSTAALRDSRQESGVGRWDEQYLSPYSFGEYLQLVGVRRMCAIGDHLSNSIHATLTDPPVVTDLTNHRRRFLVTGGFPELLLASQHETDEAKQLLNSQQRLRADAVERVIYKDIPQAVGVNDPMALERLLYMLAGQFTGIISPTNLCQSLDGMSQPTFDRYISYLERSYLIFTVLNYGPKEESVQRRGRKVFFVDGAIRNAALQRGLAPLADPSELGPLIENLAASHLHILSQHTGQRLYYWREGGREVDFILDHPDRPLAFEIGSSRAHDRSGLRALQERHKRFQSSCYLVTPDSPPRLPGEGGDPIGHIPLELFLLIVSEQAAREQRLRLGVDPSSFAASAPLFTGNEPAMDGLDAPAEKEGPNGA